MSEYTKFVKAIERNHVLFSNYPVLVPSIARELMRCTKQAQRYNETACNYGLTERQEHRAKQLNEYVRQLCASLDFGLITTGDPRGCPYKLTFPDKTTNDFAGEGYCIPRPGRS